MKNTALLLVLLAQTHVFSNAGEGQWGFGSISVNLGLANKQELESSGEESWNVNFGVNNKQSGPVGKDSVSVNVGTGNNQGGRENVGSINVNAGVRNNQSPGPPCTSCPRPSQPLEEKEPEILDEVNTTQEEIKEANVTGNERWYYGQWGEGSISVNAGVANEQTVDSSSEQFINVNAGVSNEQEGLNAADSVSVNAGILNSQTGPVDVGSTNVNIGVLNDQKGMETIVAAMKEKEPEKIHNMFETAQEEKEPEITLSMFEKLGEVKPAHEDDMSGTGTSVGKKGGKAGKSQKAGKSGKKGVRSKQSGRSSKKQSNAQTGAAGAAAAAAKHKAAKAALASALVVGSIGEVSDTLQSGGDVNINAGIANYQSFESSEGSLNINVGIANKQVVLEDGRNIDIGVFNSQPVSAPTIATDMPTAPPAIGSTSTTRVTPGSLNINAGILNRHTGPVADGSINLNIGVLNRSRPAENVQTKSIPQDATQESLETSKSYLRS